MKNVEDIYPLSPLQEGMLFHSLKEPASGAYFEQYSCHLSGALDTALYRRAWQLVIDRHTVLRTAFLWKELDQPLQVVQREVTLDWVEKDLDNASVEDIDQWLESYLKEDRARMFDLSKAPLMRFRLFRIDSDTYQWIWSYHHILSDGWSTAIILKEVEKYYCSLRDGRQTEMTPTPVPYRDFIAWLQTQDESKAKHFWHAKLRDFTSPTPIPLSRPSHFVGGYEQIETSIGVQLTANLLTITKRNRLTLNTVIQGAWAILLHRYSGEDDIVFGSTVSGRQATLNGIEEMVGLFINTLPVRVRVDPQRPFSQWLANLQTDQITARDYEYSSLSKVQSWSGLPSGVPIFESIVVFENYPRTNGVDHRQLGFVISEPNYHAHSNYPLALIVIPDHSLRIIVVYDRSRFRKYDINRIFGHFNTILQTFSEHPERAISHLSILSHFEQEKLKKWQTGPLRTNAPELVHKRFESHARLQPAATAVAYNGQNLSYGELNQRANQLALHLLGKTEAASAPIGIFLHRGIEMIIAILAVIKSGNGYVPMDPSYPRRRLDYMITDSGAKLILTVGEMAPELSPSSAELLFVDDDSLSMEANRAKHPEITIEHGDLAYIIYTSGSTGTPKGVMVNHGNLAHTTNARSNYYQQKPERFLLLSSISFDSSVAGIFGTLCTGGELHIPDRTQYQQVDYLTALIQKNKITHILCIPSLYQEMMQFFKSRLNSLKCVMVAGESCPPDLPIRHFALLPGTQLFNEYGPTETTVWSTVFNCHSDHTKRQVPIGRPIEHTRIYILDRHLKQVPPGLPGELCIGGHGVADGYMNQPEMTAKQFVSVSFDDRSEELIYKTGDRAHFLDDGNIGYLGRQDEQIKLRGYRIEAKEIETVLAGHPAVSTAAVVAREQDGKLNDLVAYAVCQANAADMIAELRRFLQAQLPHHMIPGHIVGIHKMPLTANGKIDRDALPEPDRSSSGAHDGYVAPRTQLEEKLASIWSKHLKTNKIGVGDNFFDLGGDSLLALRLIADIKKETGLNISLTSFFKTPSIEKMTSSPVDEIKIDKKSLIVPIQPKGSKIPVFNINLPIEIYSHFEDDQPFYRFKGYYDDLPFPYNRDTIESIAKRYIDSLKTSFLSGPYILCGYSADGMIAFEMARQLMTDHRSPTFLFLLDPTMPTNIQVGANSQSTTRSNGEHRYARVVGAIQENFLKGLLFIVQKLLAKIRFELKIIGIFLLSKLSKGFGYHLPIEWRRLYVMRLYGKITKRYTARQYAGPVTLCQTELHYNNSGWANLFTGDVNVHIIQGVQNHADLYHNKNTISLWVDHLKAFVSHNQDSILN